MSYGETLDKLNPCDAHIAADALSACLNGARARLLDIGCGRGDTLKYLSGLESFELSGLEHDGAYAAEAGAACPSARIAVGRADALPFGDGAFDAALMECVFSLLDRPEDAAFETVRVLSHGGVLVLSDLYARAPCGAELSGSPLLRHIYTRCELEAFFAGAGLAPAGFTDHTNELLTMLAQMILDGTACDCINAEHRLTLRQHRAGYGLWVFKKP